MWRLSVRSETGTGLSLIYNWTFLSSLAAMYRTGTVYSNRGEIKNTPLPFVVSQAGVFYTYSQVALQEKILNTSLPIVVSQTGVNNTKYSAYCCL